MDLTRKSIIAFDTETTGLIPYGTPSELGHHPARPFIISCCDIDGNAHMERFNYDPYTREVLVDKDNRWVFKHFTDFVNNPDNTLIAHNIKFDLHMLRHIGVETKCKLIDTLIIAHVITGGSEPNYKLKSISKKYLDFSDDDESALKESAKEGRRKGKKLGYCLADDVEGDYALADPEICNRYALQDAMRVMMLYVLWEKEILKDPHLKHVYKTELNLLKTLYAMEVEGVRTFPEKLEEQFAYYGSYLFKQRKAIVRLGAGKLNTKSPPQMRRMFYELRGHAPVRNKEGKISLDKIALFELANTRKDPLAAAILEYNGVKDMFSKFLRPYKRLMSRENGYSILHPSFHQTGTVTGRLSCSAPNLMQVAKPDTNNPIRLKMKYRVRELLGAKDGHLWYLPDYSQMEVWVFALLAQDPDLLQPLLSGKDFHSEVSTRLFSDKPDFTEKKKYYRSIAKQIMFTILYGGGAKVIAHRLSIPKNEASLFLTKFHREFPGIRTWSRQLESQLALEKCIYNPFGRMYRLHSKAAYKAVNYMVQGTCADLAKRAIVRVGALFEHDYPGCKPILPVHDELICQVPTEAHSPELMQKVIDCMQKDSNVFSCMPKGKKLPVTMSISTSLWSEKKSL